MSWLNNILIGKKEREDLYQKYLKEVQVSNLYNELNEQLFKYLFRGSPHAMDSNMESYISDGYTYNSIVYSIINYMATTASSVGWKLEQRKGENVDEIYDHEFLELWNNPNSDQTTSEFIEAQLIYKYATGNTWIYAPLIENGPNKGKPGKFEVAPSHVVTPIYGDTKQIVKGIIVKGQNWDKEIDIKDVLQIKYLNPDVLNESPVYGMSPLKALVKVITQNNDAWQNLASAFQNGIMPGFLSKDGATADAVFTKEQADALVERLDRSHAGPSNANKLAAIGENVKWNNIGLSPVDLNILESIKATFFQICGAYKFPPALLASETMTYNNYSEAQKILWTNSLKQDLDIIGQKITQRYLPAFGEGLVLRPDYSEIDVLQADRVQMVQWLSQAWWIKASRKQELMGENVDEEMDKYFIPAGLFEMNTMPDIGDVDENIKRLKVNGY